jgi:hypothetical protein
MNTDIKQFIWIILIIGILGYIYYINSTESFGSIYNVQKEKRDSFMIYGANNKSKSKLSFNSNENIFDIHI